MGLLKMVRSQAGLLCLIACFAATVAFVNPLRNTSVDDDWSYARSVEHLVQTGEYQLDNWASANFVVQAYWGAGFVALLGDSFPSLRISTLTLLFFGLIAFHTMLRRDGSTGIEAFLLGVGLLASPLLLFFSFSFMTDVPFVAWLLIASCLYTTAIQRDGQGWMLLGGLAAGMAIGTRQFGVALLPALAGAWLLYPGRLGKWRLYAWGFVPPLLVALWQVRMGLGEPTAYMAVALEQQSAYLHAPIAMVKVMVYRGTVILQYMALFLMPLLPLVLISVLKIADFDMKIRREDHWDFGASWRIPRKVSWLLVVSLAYVFWGAFYGYLSQRAVMPSLPWNLAFIKDFGFFFTLILNGVVTLTGGLLLWLLLRPYIPRREFRTFVRADECFLMILGLGLLGAHLIFYKIGDEYLVDLIPFVILLVRRHQGSWFPWATKLMAVSCVLGLAVSALWVRSKLESFEAAWSGCDKIHANGVPSEEIFGNWAWNSYHGAFDQWTREAKAAPAPFDPGQFWPWMEQLRLNARYWVTYLAAPPPGEHWTRLGEVHYRSLFLRRQVLYLVDRGPSFDGKPVGSPR